VANLVVPSAPRAHNVEIRVPFRHLAVDQFPTFGRAVDVVGAACSAGSRSNKLFEDSCARIAVAQTGDPYAFRTPQTGRVSCLVGTAARTRARGEAKTDGGGRCRDPPTRQGAGEDCLRLVAEQRGEDLRFLGGAVDVGIDGRYAQAERSGHSLGIFGRFVIEGRGVESRADECFTEDENTAELVGDFARIVVVSAERMDDDRRQVPGSGRFCSEAAWSAP